MSLNIRKNEYNIFFYAFYRILEVLRMEPEKESLIAHLMNIRENHEELVDKAISICTSLSTDSELDDAYQFYITILNILNEMNYHDYILYKPIIKYTGDILISLSNYGQFSTIINDYIDPDLFEDLNFVKFMAYMLWVSGLYLRVAQLYEELGLPGESFYSLIKSIDPLFERYERDTQQGDQIIKNDVFFREFWIFEMMMNPAARSGFVSQANLHFRLINVLGMSANELDLTFVNSKDFVKLGNQSTAEDIIYYCSYLEGINKDRDKRDEINYYVHYLEDQYKFEITKSKENASMIAKTLSKVTQSSFWIEKAIQLAEKNEEYYGLCLRRYYFADIDVNDIVILNLVEDMLKILAEKFPIRMTFELMKQKYNEYISDAYLFLLKRCRYEGIIKLMYLWNTSRPGSLINFPPSNKMTVLAAPYSEDGITRYYIHNGQTTEFLKVPTQNKYVPHILEHKNSLESGWAVLASSVDNDEPYLDSRHYYEDSDDYHANLSTHYAISELEKKLSSNELPILYFEFPSMGTPITSIYNIELINDVSNLIISGENIESNVKKVLIWCNPDGTLYSSQFELDAISLIFNNNDIDYEIIKENDCTKDLFLEKYIDESIDLFWIITHSHLNTEDPPDSKITISESENIAVWELQDLEIKNNRMLFLNSCQSGASSLRYNNMGQIGISQSLTTDKQKVIGHLWSVDPLASGIFGILMINKKLEGLTWSQSIKYAQKVMNQGNSQIINEISTISSELDVIGRVSRTSVDYSKLFYALSASLYV